MERLYNSNSRRLHFPLSSRRKKHVKDNTSSNNITGPPRFRGKSRNGIKKKFWSVNNDPMSWNHTFLPLRIDGGSKSVEFLCFPEGYKGGSVALWHTMTLPFCSQRIIIKTVRACSSTGQSGGLRIRRLGVRLPSGAPGCGKARVFSLVALFFPWVCF